ncbi:MAG: alpha/beta hydrolase, partial [Pseudomonadota bacterium]
KPSIIWLAGLKSDMLSTKATALADWAPTRGMGLTRFDYSGHGESSGKFEEALISHWVEEAMCVLEQLTAGPQILVGSSTGAHVALVLLRRLIQKKSMYADRIKGLVLIAPAWDLTEELMWKTFPDDGRKAIETQGFYDMPSDYGEPYRITRAFIEDGRRDLIRPDPFDPGRPVEVLQGLLDDAVPAPHARELASVLHGDWVRLTEIADGDHRLSRDPDIELLFEAIERVAG